MSNQPAFKYVTLRELRKTLEAVTDDTEDWYVYPRPYGPWPVVPVMRAGFVSEEQNVGGQVFPPGLYLEF